MKLPQLRFVPVALSIFFLGAVALTGCAADSEDPNPSSEEGDDVVEDEPTDDVLSDTESASTCAYGMYAGECISYYKTTTLCTLAAGVGSKIISTTTSYVDPATRGWKWYESWVGGGDMPCTQKQNHYSWRAETTQKVCRRNSTTTSFLNGNIWVAKTASGLVKRNRSRLSVPWGPHGICGVTVYGTTPWTPWSSR